MTRRLALKLTFLPGILAFSVGFPSTALGQAADLSITLDAQSGSGVDQPGVGHVGSHYWYILSVHNAGPDVATDVEVVDTLPSEFAVQEPSVNQGCELEAGNRVACTAPSLAPSPAPNPYLDLTFVIPGEPISSGDAIVNTASVRAATSDPHPENNVATYVSRFEPPLPPSELWCNIPPTLFGTSNADVLAGTGGEDSIVGRGGRDTIRGAGAADYLCGDAGADTVHGGTGADFLEGGSQGDTLIGGPGRDWLNGGPGDDECAGGAGRDVRRSC